MKVNLLGPDDAGPLHIPPNRAVLVEDLELRRLYAAMAGQDEFIFTVVKQVVPSALIEPDWIRYRQDVLADCLANPAVVRQMYDIVTDAVENRRKSSYAGFLFRAPEAIVYRSIERLELLVESIEQLRRIGSQHCEQFTSAGLRHLFAMLAAELDDAYLARINRHLDELRFPRGVLFSAQLGPGNKGAQYVLHRPPHRRRHWFPAEVSSGAGFRVDDNDEVGSRALIGLSGHGINAVAGTLSRSADHVQAFCARLRAELAFYVGCLNLAERLAVSSSTPIPLCFPEPLPWDEPDFTCVQLRDVGLCLTTRAAVVGNDVNADGKSLIMVTGANAGGKSTFLRSVGTAQMMMQAGMFVTAEALRANVVDYVFTHFTREEDSTMQRGKLDDELARCSEIADAISPHSLLLCNESFSSTNEREGSAIARQVVRALTEAGVKIGYVTHLYDLAHGRYAEHRTTDLFLRAERRRGGIRTFRLLEAEPEPTSHGEDSFRRIFTPAAAG